jgi:hypothetical protein
LTSSIVAGSYQPRSSGSGKSTASDVVGSSGGAATAPENPGINSVPNGSRANNIKRLRVADLTMFSFDAGS